MIAPMNDQLQDTAQPAPGDDHGRGRRYQACRAVNAFLREVLTKGPVAVIELEPRARKVRLLGGRQRITDAKDSNAPRNCSECSRNVVASVVVVNGSGNCRSGPARWWPTLRLTPRRRRRYRSPMWRIIPDPSRALPESQRCAPPRIARRQRRREATVSRWSGRRVSSAFITDGSMPASPLIAGTSSSMTAPSFSIRTTVGQAALPNLVGTLWRCLAAIGTGPWISLALACFGVCLVAGCLRFTRTGLPSRAPTARSACSIGVLARRTSRCRGSCGSEHQTGQERGPSHAAERRHDHGE